MLEGLAYNKRMVIHLLGPLDVAALEQVLNEILTQLASAGNAALHIKAIRLRGIKHEVTAEWPCSSVVLSPL